MALQLFTFKLDLNFRSARLDVGNYIFGFVWDIVETIEMLLRWYDPAAALGKPIELENHWVGTNFEIMSFCFALFFHLRVVSVLHFRHFRLSTWSTKTYNWINCCECRQIFVANNVEHWPPYTATRKKLVPSWILSAHLPKKLFWWNNKIVHFCLFWKRLWIDIEAIFFKITFSCFVLRQRRAEQEKSKRSK